MEGEKFNAEIEFNSMGAVLRRIDGHTNCINYARRNRMYVFMIDSMIDYYKEIEGDCTVTEKNIWAEITKLKETIYNFLGISQNTTASVANTPYAIIKELDDLDIKIRGLAKIHGYTTKQSKDVRRTVLEM